MTPQDAARKNTIAADGAAVSAPAEVWAVGSVICVNSGLASGRAPD
jgi:hypothetical protein